MITIRPTTAADIPALRTLLVETWHATYDASMGADRVTAITDEWHGEDRLRQEIDNQGCRSLVAESGDAILGHALLCGLERPEAVLSRLYVSPAAQGGGIGAKLFDAAMGSLYGTTALTLEVEEANDKARHFYAKQGFVELERRSNCGDQDGIPTLILRKELTSR